MSDTKQYRILILIIKVKMNEYSCENNKVNIKLYFPKSILDSAFTSEKLIYFNGKVLHIKKGTTYIPTLY